MLTASIVTAFCPHKLLGRITPELKRKGNSILGLYAISLNQYPVLKNLWGSVRIEIPNKYWRDGFFAPIIITHVPKKIYDVDYTCIYTICPHRGKIVGNLSIYFDDENIPIEQKYKFVCDGHGSVFNPDGSFFDGPANGLDLTHYYVMYDGDDTLTMEIPGLISNISDIIDLSNKIYYLNQNEPNPADKLTMLRYGIEKADYINISIYTLMGKEILNPVNSFHKAGHYSFSLDTSQLPAGIYLCKMVAGEFEPIIRKMIVRH
jgi:nitrite reductase/ring-hydroxylating ferredoxin subunit